MSSRQFTFLTGPNKLVFVCLNGSTFASLVRPPSLPCREFSIFSNVFSTLWGIFSFFYLFFFLFFSSLVQKNTKTQIIFRFRCFLITFFNFCSLICVFVHFLGYVFVLFCTFDYFCAFCCFWVLFGACELFS